ncbi:hypothetical protein TorRG33x02_014740 [Trema orientale]|uniref:Uncharacterized protein n=1 Tax=Trema orientale TaxID=63057 RepID=A0A2P5FXI0_TREOI|nr:hypothetical protein TorRG33x02_014740 [Trema orientale]
MTSAISGRPCTSLAALSRLLLALRFWVKDREFEKKTEWNLVRLEERRWNLHLLISGLTKR